MSSNECYAYFGLSGLLNPSAISAELGLSPSRIGLAGEQLRSGKVRSEGFWNLDDRIARDARIDFEARVKDVLDQLAPHLEAASRLSRAFHGTIMLVGYFHEYDPGLWLEADTVHRIATLGASFQCDFYQLIEREPNQPLQRNAGSRPSSDDSLVSETPSSLSPRG